MTDDMKRLLALIDTATDNDRRNRAGDLERIAAALGSIAMLLLRQDGEAFSEWSRY